MSRAVVAILCLVVVAFLGATVFEAGLATAGNDNNVTGESWTPNAGTVTELQYSNLDGAYYDDEVEVRDTNDVVMDRGTDYEWYDTNGTVKALVGGDLEGENNAVIDYTYKQTTEEQQELTAVLGLIPQYIGLVLPLFVVVLLFIILRG